MKLFVLAFVVLAIDRHAAVANNTTTTSDVEPCENATDTNIISFLMANYDKRARPIRKPNVPVNIRLGVVVESIKEIREIDQIITLAGYLYLYWVDEYLVWNNTPAYNCVTTLMLPGKSIWLPELALTSVDGKYKLLEAEGDEIARIYSNGQVHMRPGGIFSVPCQFDLRMFPYDFQSCTVHIQSWMHQNKLVAFQKDTPVITTTNWIENEEWQLLNMSAELNAVSYRTKTHFYHSLWTTLVLKRKTGYYLMNVILPSQIISLAELITFTIPLHEVARIEISFTILLAYSVFQLMVIPNLPATADYTPLLSIYIVLAMAYIGVAMLGHGLTFLLLGKAKRSRQGPPALIVTLLGRGIGRLLGVPQHRSEFESDVQALMIDYNGSQTSVRNSISQINLSSERLDAVNTDGISDHLSNGEEPSVRAEKDSNYSDLTNQKMIKRAGLFRRKKSSPSTPHFSIGKEHWIILAEAMARLTALLYTLLIVLTPVVMFIVMPSLESGYVRFK